MERLFLASNKNIRNNVRATIPQLTWRFNKHSRARSCTDEGQVLWAEWAPFSTAN